MLLLFTFTPRCFRSRCYPRGFTATQHCYSMSVDDALAVLRIWPCGLFVTGTTRPTFEPLNEPAFFFLWVHAWFISPFIWCCKKTQRLSFISQINTAVRKALENCLSRVFMVHGWFLMRRTGDGVTVSLYPLTPVDTAGRAALPVLTNLLSF